MHDKANLKCIQFYMTSYIVNFCRLGHTIVAIDLDLQIWFNYSIAKHNGFTECVFVSNYVIVVNLIRTYHLNP